MSLFPRYRLPIPDVFTMIVTLLLWSYGMWMQSEVLPRLSRAASRGIQIPSCIETGVENFPDVRGIHIGLYRTVASPAAVAAAFVTLGSLWMGREAAARRKSKGTYLFCRVRGTSLFISTSVLTDHLLEPRLADRSDLRYENYLYGSSVMVPADRAIVGTIDHAMTICKTAVEPQTVCLFVKTQADPDQRLHAWRRELPDLCIGLNAVFVKDTSSFYRHVGTKRAPACS